ncbi:MAG: DNA polymerase III subunit delta [Sphingomonadales bacterium]|nr:DNA polymerase III subunit delta [Sphingomonadales bacterium]
MKASQRDFAGVAPRAAQAARVFFLCGPDEAGIHDAAIRLVSLLPNPGERVELSGAALRSDPVLLGDEARSTSLFGDSRHIVVRASGDEAEKAVELMLSGDVPPCPVLILAANATDKSRTAKLLADRPDALVAVFWPPDLKAATENVRALADKAGVRIDQALAERIARGTGLDSRLAQSEVEKLALYLDASPERPRKGEAAALDAIGASTEEDGFSPLINAVLGGDSAKLPAELRRVRELGLNAVGVLMAFERRTAQLAQLAGRLAGRGDVAAFMKGESAARRVFFKEERDLTRQLERWRGKRLQRLINRLMRLHQDLLANSQDAELLLLHELSEITRFASRR